jgi:hypothetical protein
MASAEKICLWETWIIETIPLSVLNNPESGHCWWCPVLDGWLGSVLSFSSEAEANACIQRCKEKEVYEDHAFRAVLLTRY